jgi:hypothetical protein
MTSLGHKSTQCLLVAVMLLFCAGALPFNPAADDSDENFGRASVQILVSSDQHAPSQLKDGTANAAIPTQVPSRVLLHPATPLVCGKLSAEPLEIARFASPLRI